MNFKTVSNDHSSRKPPIPAKSIHSSEVLSKMSEAIPGELFAATTKVTIGKHFDHEAEQKLINLNAVSASCPIMNL